MDRELCPDYPLNPELQKEIRAFSEWLEAETLRQKRRVELAEYSTLAFYVVALGGMVLLLGRLQVSERTATFLMMAGCTFTVVCALKSLLNALLLSGFQTSMNVRYLATFLHDLRRERSHLDQNR